MPQRGASSDRSTPALLRRTAMIGARPWARRLEARSLGTSGLGARLVPVRAAEGARGSAERGVRRTRRRWVLGTAELWRAGRDAEHRSDLQPGCALHAVSHDRTVLADARVPADRAQPHAQQHACITEAASGFPNASGV